MPNIDDLEEHIVEISARWSEEIKERQARRELFQADFDELRDAGFTLVGVPEAEGGMWESIERSTEPICEVLRTLAHGDPSVALVATMHPAVLLVFGWLLPTEAPGEYQKTWSEQKDFAFQTAREGHFWGTITSEPGSSGDISRTKTSAKSDGDSYLLNGIKHFGSGTGITSFIVTTAVPEGESEVEDFFVDMRDNPLDGSNGVNIIAPWDGHGMSATQSHGLAFEDMPAVRRSWKNAGATMRPLASAPVACMFTAVIVGVVENAVSTAREQLRSKHERLSAFEQVEWSRVEIEAWQIEQLYRGMLQSITDPNTRARQSLLGKTAIAELSESLLTRLSKVIGGSSFSRFAPYGMWAQDVRALGFLRPPWGLAYELIYKNTW